MEKIKSSEELKKEYEKDPHETGTDVVDNAGKIWDTKHMSPEELRIIEQENQSRFEDAFAEKLSPLQEKLYEQKDLLEEAWEKGDMTFDDEEDLLDFLNEYIEKIENGEKELVKVKEGLEELRIQFLGYKEKIVREMVEKDGTGESLVDKQLRIADDLLGNAKKLLGEFEERRAGVITSGKDPKKDKKPDNEKKDDNGNDYE